MNNQSIIDTGLKITEDSENLTFQTFQQIPQHFIDGLKEEKFRNSQGRVKNEYHRAASIPVAVVEKWLKEGYDVFKEPVKKSIARLKAENLDYFITSEKA